MGSHIGASGIAGATGIDQSDHMLSSPRRPRRLVTLQIGCLISTLLGLVAGTCAGAAPPVADTKFSQDRGFHRSPFTVQITTKTRDAAIFYTTNGSAPTRQSGLRYDHPIQITRSTVLRAAAFQEGAKASNVDTHTCLFLNDVVGQTGAGFPARWGFNNGQPVSADYEMDPEITTHPAYRELVLPALRSLPAMSVVMDPSDLFDPARGIYSNPKESGAEWERPASVELLFPDGRPGFHINCGIRIQGGWNRRPEESPKHSFRLVFRKSYGSGKLKFPLFGEAGVKEFDTLILRAGCNNTWLHWSGEERRRGDFVRDQWMRDTYREMGHLSARGRFVHLYLNGLYWGLYNPCERPSGPFVAAHQGGSADDYDARNGNNLIDGDDVIWKQMITLANAGVTNTAQFTALHELVDMPALIDFLILNFYGANADWDRSSNWYAARRRNPPGPYQFFVWDGERTLEDANANTMAFDDDQSPTRLFQKLRGHPRFKRLFEERARLHLTGQGALTPLAAAQRYQKLAQEIDTAVIAESARWGDYRRDAHRYKTGPYELYTRDEHWRPEINRLAQAFFPQRTAVVLDQFRGTGLYPSHE